jgi:ribose-phosphate pyrophosphokinase
MSVVFKGTDVSVPINFVKMYSDATPMIKTGEDDWDKIVYECDTLVLRAGSLMEFVYGMFLCDSIRESGGRISKLILPYLPGARQDRVNPTGDVLYTASSVAQMVNARQFDTVLSVDPHSGVMPALINNFVEYPLEDVYAKLWMGYTGVIAPDKGATLRGWRAGDMMNLPVAFGSKVRDVSTGALTGFAVADLEEGGHYIVVDDICDGGGTFIGLGEKIKEQGAYADLFVTHGIFSKGTDGLKKIFNNIYTTDTREIHERNDVYVLPVVEEMENYNV